MLLNTFMLLVIRYIIHDWELFTLAAQRRAELVPVDFMDERLQFHESLWLIQEPLSMPGHTIDIANWGAQPEA